MATVSGYIHPACDEGEKVDLIQDPVVVVTGGAGYIGSHMVKMLVSTGHRVVVIDDLSSGFEWAVQDVDFIRGSIGDRDLLRRCFITFDVAAVIHFAGMISVSESSRRPDLYYESNVVNSLVLFDEMLKNRVDKLIFSSTAAIFGNPSKSPIDESCEKNPINPYGRSKFMVEEVLADYDLAFAFRSASLRYFNAAGADPAGALGECHEPETHLIPLVLQVASGRRRSIGIFGDSYPTHDGTCIRDYIHVEDLCSAHMLALKHLLSGGQSVSYNLGNGNGFSVREVIAAAERVSSGRIRFEILPPRFGDSPILVADSSAIQRELGWHPKYPELDEIIKHAWHWEQHYHCQGF